MFQQTTKTKLSCSNFLKNHIIIAVFSIFLSAEKTNKRNTGYALGSLGVQQSRGGVELDSIGEQLHSIFQAIWMNTVIHIVTIFIIITPPLPPTLNIRMKRHNINALGVIYAIPLVTTESFLEFLGKTAHVYTVTALAIFQTGVTSKLAKVVHGNWSVTVTRQIHGPPCYY